MLLPYPKAVQGLCRLVIAVKIDLDVYETGLEKMKLGELLQVCVANV